MITSAKGSTRRISTKGAKYVDGDSLRASAIAYALRKTTDPIGGPTIRKMRTPRKNRIAFHPADNSFCWVVDELSLIIQFPGAASVSAHATKIPSIENLKFAAAVLDKLPIVIIFLFIPPHLRGVARDAC